MSWKTHYHWLADRARFQARELNSDNSEEAQLASVYMMRAARNLDALAKREESN